MRSIQKKKKDESHSFIYPTSVIGYKNAYFTSKANINSTEHVQVHYSQY